MFQLFSKWDILSIDHKSQFGLKGCTSVWSLLNNKTHLFNNKHYEMSLKIRSIHKHGWTVTNQLIPIPGGCSSQNNNNNFGWIYLTLRNQIDWQMIAIPWPVQPLDYLIEIIGENTPKCNTLSGTTTKFLHWLLLHSVLRDFSRLRHLKVKPQD